MNGNKKTCTDAAEEGLSGALNGNPLEAGYVRSKVGATFLGGFQMLGGASFALVAGKILPAFVNQTMQKYVGASAVGLFSALNTLIGGLSVACFAGRSQSDIENLEKIFNVEKKSATLLRNGLFFVEEDTGILHKKSNVARIRLFTKERAPLTTQYMAERLELCLHLKVTPQDVLELLKGNAIYFEKFLSKKTSWMNGTYGPLVLDALLRLGLAAGASYYIAPLMATALT